MARAIGASLFETALGDCGIAWSEFGLVGVQLPEADEARTRERLRRRHGLVGEGRMPPEVQQAVDGIVELLRGNPADLTAVRLDVGGVPNMHQRVYDITRTVARGETITYGEIAQRLGDASLARAVGQALARNPFAIVVPCHRVLAAGGRSGGFSGGAGVATKLRLLAIEGAKPRGGPDLFEAIDAPRHGFDRAV